MTSYEQAIKQSAERAVLDIVSSGKWIDVKYDDRFKLPANFVQEAWQLVDKEKVKQQLATRIESELADRIVNHMAAEMATDIKQVLSVQERREAIRSLARQHMEAIMQGKTLT